MKLTKEQLDIINYTKNNEGLVLVSSIAGSGKTTLLTQISKAVKPKTALYLAYTKAVAVEAQKKFPKEVHCCTTHSLAYTPIVRALHLKIGTFGYRQVTGLKRYEEKLAVVEYFHSFCLSAYTDFEKFAKKESLPKKIADKITEVLSDMQTGKLDCTHDFYLKLYHISLADKSITYEPFDLVMLDEAGDLNQVTLEIFKLLPAKHKVMVGDPSQNIFTFNHTINCFALDYKKCNRFTMSKSFRTSEEIAKRIQAFCRLHLSENMKFEGVKITNTDIKTKAYIARTNAALIGKMIKLNQMRIPYGLTRKAKQIFAIPLALCGLKYKGFISEPSLRFLQNDVNHYYEDTRLNLDFKTPLMYIKDIYPDDVVIQQTIKVLLRYGQKAIIDCYESARQHEKINQNYMLGTAHSTKGLEFDQVEISDDLNNILDNIMLNTMYGKENNYSISDMPNYTETEQTELNLYYVACSRAKKVLINARHLPKVIE